MDRRKLYLTELDDLTCCIVMPKLMKALTLFADTTTESDEHTQEKLN